jgi:precorrin-2 dehydrogenase/sirohydrochlorin ferrochelatase
MRGLMIYQLLEGQIAVVVGAGNVGMRRIHQLKEVGARVRLVDPNVDNCAQATEIISEAYEISHLQGASIVFASTNNTAINRQIAGDARQLGIPVNVADDPEYCDFYMAAVVERGDLTVAISTGGLCPGFASLAKRHLDQQWGPEWGLALEIMAAARRWAKQSELPWTQLLNDKLLLACANRDKRAVESQLTSVLGANASLNTIGVHWS